MGKILLGRVKGEHGKNVFIKFNHKPEMEGATDYYQEGMKYMGIISSDSVEKPTDGYVWIKFVGDNGKDAQVSAATEAVAGVVKLGAAGGAARHEHSHGSITFLTGTLSGTTLTLTEQTKDI